jgi:hypothetical protein
MASKIKEELTLTFTILGCVVGGFAFRIVVDMVIGAL